MSQAEREMPRYQCHKQVWALKIQSITLATPDAPLFDFHTGAPAGAAIVPVDPGYAMFTVSPEYVTKHEPKVGGYYVVYRDGYKSWSPAKEFEEGYTRI